MALIVELLDPDIHSRGDFNNEIPEIDKFLKEKANKEHKLGFSDTFVIVDDGKREKIEGYFTLSNSAVILTDIPTHLIRSYESVS